MGGVDAARRGQRRAAVASVSERVDVGLSSRLSSASAGHRLFDLMAAVVNAMLRGRWRFGRAHVGTPQHVLEVARFLLSDRRCEIRHAFALCICSSVFLRNTLEENLRIACAYE